MLINIVNNNICDETDNLVEISEFSSLQKSHKTVSELGKRLPT